MRRVGELVLGLVAIGCGFVGVLILVASSGTYLLIPMLLLVIAASAGIMLRHLLKKDSSNWPAS